MTQATSKQGEANLDAFPVIYLLSPELSYLLRREEDQITGTLHFLFSRTLYVYQADEMYVQARGLDSKFLDMGAVIYVDGVQVGSTSVKTREGAAPTMFGGPCASGTKWRKLFFRKPVHHPVPLRSCLICHFSLDRR